MSYRTALSLPHLISSSVDVLFCASIMIYINKYIYTCYVQYIQPLYPVCLFMFVEQHFISGESDTNDK